MSDRGSPIIVEQEFDLPISEVWKAIAEHSQLVKWFFEDIPEFKAETGFQTRFNVSTENRDFMHLWTILEAVPNKKITYDWRYENIPGRGCVTFELSELDGKTLLRLTNTGLESFPEDQPEFERESCIGGWQYFIQNRLVQYLSVGDNG